MPRVCLWFVIVVFPDHSIHLLFFVMSVDTHYILSNRRDADEVSRNMAFHLVFSLLTLFAKYPYLRVSIPFCIIM